MIGVVDIEQPHGIDLSGRDIAGSALGVLQKVGHAPGGLGNEQCLACYHGRYGILVILSSLRQNMRLLAVGRTVGRKTIRKSI